MPRKSTEKFPYKNKKLTIDQLLALPECEQSRAELLARIKKFPAEVAIRSGYSRKAVKPKNRVYSDAELDAIREKNKEIMSKPINPRATLFYWLSQVKGARR